MLKNCIMLLLAGCVLLTCAAGMAEESGAHLLFEPSAVTPRNPLMGFAPQAQDTARCEPEQLVYIGLYWSDWEPEEGVFDIEGFEKRYNIARWKAEGKNAVLRFICDYPDKKAHMDIPQWLYDKTGNGVHYKGPYGKGYSPDYTDPVFIEAHRKAIAALAEYCNRDGFVAYVQLGSLGHWGEWHVTGAGKGVEMPPDSVIRTYVSHYLGQFGSAALMTRRSYALTVENGMGIYNDMAGNKHSTQAWLDWTREGGYQPAQSGVIGLAPYPAFWEKAPVGGELASSVRLKNRSEKVIREVLDAVAQGHMTFLGPNVTTTKKTYERVRGLLGYRLYVSEMTLSQEGLVLTWQNDGAAPMYRDWPAEVLLYGEDGECLLRETTDLKLSELAPGRVLMTRTDLAGKADLREIRAVGVRIREPEGGRTVTLAMDLPPADQEGVRILWQAE